MDASTPAQEERAQLPSTNSPPPMDSRNDTVAHDESAPLLEAGDMAPPTRDMSTKLFYIFTSAALSSSALTLIFIIAAFIALEFSKISYGLSWEVSESMKAIIPPVLISSNPQLCCQLCAHMLQAVFSLLFSSYNLALLRNRLGIAPGVAPLAVNMLCDILVAAFTISYGATALSVIRYGPLIPAKILAAIALGIGIICG